MRLLLALAAACGAAFVAVGHVEPSSAPRRPPPLVSLRPQPAPTRARRPPQFVVVSFDGAGGARLWHGTHFNGHFCEPYPGNVDQWTARDWNRELDQFGRLLFRASENNGLRPPTSLPFGAREIVGERTPCLQGRLPLLYRVLARRGFRYDASALARLGTWPQRRLDIWSVPLLEIPFAGHDFLVVSMDYNFFANQTGGVSAGPAAEAGIERETYLSLRNAFRTSYLGNRAPISFANHFETWNHWAYDRALARVVLESCRLPEVRCVSFRELVDWLDAQPPALLRRFRTGRFRIYRP